MCANSARSSVQIGGVMRFFYDLMLCNEDEDENEFLTTLYGSRQEMDELLELMNKCRGDSSFTYKVVQDADLT